MQKKIIALAVAGLVAAPAFAQTTNVQITGIAAVSATNYKVSSPNAVRAAALSTENRLDDQTSRFTLKGTEDLGGGMSAYFQIENRVSLDSRDKRDNSGTFGNATGLADGESFVGIKHNNIGSLGFGKYAMHYHETLGYSESYRAMNTQNYSIDLMGAVGGWFIAQNSRAQNAIKYDTPNWNGFSGKVIYSFNPAGNEGLYNAANPDYNKGSAWNVAVRYYQGPINVYASYFKHDMEGNGATAADQTSYKIGGDYKFPFGLKVGLHYDHSKIAHAGFSAVPALFSPIAGGGDTAVKRSAWMLPISYNFGAHGVYLTYIKAGNLKGVGFTDSGAQKWVLAYDYALSRRTYLGASYMQLKNKTNGFYNPWLAGASSLGGSAMGGLFGGVAGEKGRQFSLNVTHFF
ncbi:MAG: porin [Proteobacteria bacterium]|nr:porin [Pseudomonadota bacterium]